MRRVQIGTVVILSSLAVVAHAHRATNMTRVIKGFGVVAMVVVALPVAAQERLGSGSLSSFSEVSDAPVDFTTQDVPRPSVRPAIIGGIVGTAAGAGAGYLIGRARTAGCTADDCDIGGDVGFVLGSWVGAAIGAHAGAGRAGRDPSVGRAVLGSTLGVLGGLFSSIMITSMDTETEHSPIPYVIAWTALHGAVAGLVTAAGR